MKWKKGIDSKWSFWPTFQFKAPSVRKATFHVLNASKLNSSATRIWFVALENPIWNKVGMMHVSSRILWSYWNIVKTCKDVNLKADSMISSLLRLQHWLLSVSSCQCISRGSVCSFSAPPSPPAMRTTSSLWRTPPRAPPGPRSRHRGRTPGSGDPSPCSQTPRGIDPAVLKHIYRFTSDPVGKS